MTLDEAKQNIGKKAINKDGKIAVIYSVGRYVFAKLDDRSYIDMIDHEKFELIEE